MNFEINKNDNIRILNEKNGSGDQALKERSESRKQGLEATVEQKYRLFFAGLEVSTALADELKQLLVDREQVLEGESFSSISDEQELFLETEQQQAMLACIDQEIAHLLKDEEYVRFELFRESGLEQYQLKRFKHSLGDIPLTEFQAEKLLLAKLTHKTHFLNALAEAHQFNEAGDDQSARFSIEQAVRQYHRTYLDDAKSVLDEQQWLCLERFEAREFEDIYLISLSAT